MKLKDACSLEGKLWQIYIAYYKAETSLCHKDLYSQSCGFSSSHVWMWELDQKKAECRRIDAFELWCWRRLLRVTWTARRSNQSIRKEINSKSLLEGLMLKLELQYFGHLMWRADLLLKTPIMEKIEGRRKRGWQRMRWLDDIINSMDMSLSKPQEIVTGVLRSMGSQRVGHNWVTEQQ